MMNNLFTLDCLDTLEKNLQAETQEDRPILEISISQIDTRQLEESAKSSAFSLDFGQEIDSQHSLLDGSSMHIHWYPKDGYARIHRDRNDPTRNPVAHLFQDTGIGKGIVTGCLLALFFGIAIKSGGKGTLILMGVAASTGGYIASESEAPSHCWVLSGRTWNKKELSIMMGFLPKMAGI